MKWRERIITIEIKQERVRKIVHYGNPGFTSTASQENNSHRCTQASNIVPTRHPFLSVPLVLGEEDQRPRTRKTLAVAKGF